MATIKEFKKNYIKAMQEGYAAIFAGAGLSRASGFVNWKELLRDIAEEISLDVDRETDLVEVAQFYCNESGGRSGINEKYSIVLSVIRNLMKAYHFWLKCQ